jgi:hypothetical protein
MIDFRRLFAKKTGLSSLKTESRVGLASLSCSGTGGEGNFWHADVPGAYFLRFNTRRFQVGVVWLHLLASDRPVSGL